MSSILVCDDDDGILKMLKIMLMFEGFDVIATNDSSKIFDLLKKRLPDILLIDLWMPVIPGYEVIKNIRANPKTSTIPIIAISASTDGYNNAKTAGADEFIPKPFDIYYLTQLIERLLSSRQ